MGLRTRFWVGLICLLATAFSHFAEAAVQIHQAPYHGWNEAFIISNGKVEAVVVPQVGRIMQFRFAGENDGPFWENHALDGKAPDAASKEWGNFGGDKTWPSPQGDWEKITGRGWPPPAAFDSMAVKGRIEGEEVVLESPVDPHFGIQTERRISLNSEKSEMKVKTIYRKMQGKPLTTGIWIITQAKDPEKIFMPLRKESVFPKGYNEQSEKLPTGLEIKNGILQCQRSAKNSTKIGSDADTLIWGDARWLLQVTSKRESSGDFPDRGSSAEIYTNSDPLKYIELELLGPLKEMKNNDRIEREETYTLFRRGKEPLEEEVKKLL